MSEFLSETNSWYCTTDHMRSVICMQCASWGNALLELAANQQWRTLNHPFLILVVTEQHTSAPFILFVACALTYSPTQPHTEKDGHTGTHSRTYGDRQVAQSTPINPKQTECTCTHQCILRPVSLWAWLCVDYCMIFTAGVWEAL